MNKEIILFYYPNLDFRINKLTEKKLRKNYSKIILFNTLNKNELLNTKYNKQNLNKIKENYKQIGIHLDLKKIYEIDFFLKKIRYKNKLKNIFVSPFFISSVILEEEFIFYELSKIYNIQFVRADTTFIKNRFILAKDFLKQPYPLKKKTYFSSEKYKIFKKNYIKSINSFSTEKQNKNFYFSNILTKIFSFFLLFRFNVKPKKYVLVILNNDKNLNLLSGIKLKYFIKKFFTNFNFELVFLLHPRKNPFIYFIQKFISEKIFFNDNKIIFIQKPKNLSNLIKNSEFIIHLSSSLSAQALAFNKKILCLGKNLIYINRISNVVSNIRKSNLNFLKKKINKKDILKIDKSLIKILSISVDINGEFKLSTKKKYYMLKNYGKSKNYKEKIILELLNAI